MSGLPQLVCASANPDKVAEIATLLAGMVDLLPRPAGVPDVVEDADTLEGNARLKAVAVSQVAQLPVVLSGSIGYVQAGLTDIGLGTVLGIGAAFGTVAGALVATRLHPERLRDVVALACLTAGVVLAVRTIATLV